MSNQHSLNLFKQARAKSIILAVALAVPGTAALAESADAVKARSDQDVQHYGRDSVYAPLPPMVFTPPKDPKVYGRAGGYVGADQIGVAASTGAVGSDVVKSGESQVNAPNSQANAMSAQREQRDVSQTNSLVSSLSGTLETGRVSGGRFDNPESAHGQRETGTQVQ
jgi:hypothetical protein